MKKLFLILFLFSLGLHLNAQENSDARKNDIMIDPIFLITVPAINASYERILSQDSGVGANVLFSLSSESSGDYQISPYYRMYFGKKYASGFFVDAFVPFTSSTVSRLDYNSVNNNYTSVDERKVTAGIGVGLGGKWIAKRNIIFETSIGFARRFISSDYSSPVTGRIMLGIGHRF